MRTMWHRWLKRSREEIPSWLGLCFGGLYLAAVAAVGIAAIHVLHGELAAQRLADGKSWTRWLVRSIVHIPDQDPETIAHEIRRAAREDGILYCEIVSPDGIITVHSDPTRTGKVAESLSWDAATDGDVRVGIRPDDPDTPVLASEIRSPAGNAPPHELRVGLANRRLLWTQSDILFWSGYILLVVLGLYLVAYRFLRRSVQPLAVIKGRLINCEESLSGQISALRINDSYDEISTSWNQLIEFVAHCQEQISQTELTTDVTAAMDGYRSERLTNILMQIPFGILVLDVDETILFTNRAAVGMLGTPGESLDNTPADAILDESLRMALFGALRSESAGQSQTSRWIDHTLERPHGRVSLRFWSTPRETGSTELVIFVQDVTQAKEAEHARDQFLYHVTHELRTPLTNIRAYAETLSQGVIDDEQTIRECYNVIMGETQRLSRLVEDILSVSQLEVGTARLDVREVQLDKLLRGAVQDAQGIADGKDIDLLLNLPAKVPRVRGDKDRLAVVFTNLIGNAIKYTPQGGRVDVGCVAENERVRISVSDTGIGIDAADQERIFDKFYRVDSEQVAGIAGTGLGLAIVKETVRVHGGSILVTSTPSKGTTFTLVLPTIPLDGNGAEGTPITSVEGL